MRRALLVLGVVSACSSEPVETDETAGALTLLAIPRGSTWRYWDGGGELGTSWRGGFDDASWSTGAGPLGYGESYVRTPLWQGPITHYFRRTFTITDPAAITAMVGDLMYDDGLVVYLNGREIGRDAMPTGPVTARTLATGHEAGNVYGQFDWGHHIDVLVAGTNTLAVEVHQVSAGSSDLVFDLALTVETTVAPPPAPGGIPRNASWWYWDDGGGRGTAWRTVAGPAAGWDTGAGPLGYGESYLRTAVARGPITTYFRRDFTIDDPARIATLVGEVMYDDGFVAYLNGVEIQRAAMPAGAVTASTLAAGHEAEGAYTRHDWTAHRPLLVAGTNVLAVEVHQASATSSDLVFDVALTVERAPSPPPAPVEIATIRRRDFWMFWDRGGAPDDPSWKTSTRPDSPPWGYGYGPFGYGESYLVTPVAYGSRTSARHITTYFWSTISTYNPGAVTRIVAEVMYDDGFVLYLDGVEVARRAMPAGPITPTTLALGHEANNTYETIDLSAYRHLLQLPTTIVTVEVHQQSPSSSDLVFDLAMTLYGEQPPAPDRSEDTARGSAWRYWDGADPRSPSIAGWKDPDFNDAQWSTGAGPLGYGESYVTTAVRRGPVTTYLRRSFTVDAPSAQTRMRAELMYDDGVIVYLNGHELLRRNLPGSSVDHGTLASSPREAGNAYEVVELGAFNGSLVAGTNVLAVEVHQAEPAGDDLVFDLALQLETPPVCAVPGGGAAVAPAPSDGLFDVWVGPATVVTVGGDGTVGRRGDAAWCWAEVGGDVTWRAVWGAADDDVWIVGGLGQVRHYDGARFTPVDVGTTAPLTDVFGTAPDDVWIVGVRGTIRHFDGTTWTAHDLPTDQGLQAGWAASPDDLWVSGFEPAPYPGDPTYDGSSSVIYRWVPTTRRWRLEVRNTVYYGSATFRSLHGSSANDVWAVGEEHPAGAACQYSGMAHWDGVSWSTVAGAPVGCRTWSDVAAGGPGAADGAWIVGSGEDAEGAWRYTGGTWQDVPSPLTMTAIDHLADRMWAVGVTGGFGRQLIVRWDGTGFVDEW